MLDNTKKRLLEVAKVLNENDITWGLGGSLLLDIHGYDVTVNDIDLMVDAPLEDVIKLFLDTRVITNLEISPYQTDYLVQIKGDIVVDIMIGFKYITPEGLYEYPKGANIVEKTIQIDEVDIPLCKLSDWKDLYEAIGRTDKVEILKQDH